VIVNRLGRREVGLCDDRCWLSFCENRRPSIYQSWIAPGARAGGEGDVAGAVVGLGVTGAARDGANVLDAALGGGSELMVGTSAGLSSSLCGGFSRVSGGLPGAAG
jgi:hypothetical protein